MFKKILLAYDGSDPAKKAFDRCIEMTQSFEAELSIVGVIRPPEFAEDVETEALIENARARFRGDASHHRSRGPPCRADHRGG